MDEKELEFILKEGEGQTREFKLRFESSLAEDFTAFANSTGGTIFLDDRIEIISPGGLPPGFEKSDFGKLSVRRNQLIADIFSRTPYVEQLGSGIQRMRQLMKNVGLLLPKFEMNHFFVVTFQRKEPEKEPEKRKAEILHLLEMRGSVSRKEMVFKLKIPLGTLKKDLAVLQTEGLVVRVGSDKKGHYALLKEKKIKNQ